MGGYRHGQQHRCVIKQLLCSKGVIQGVGKWFHSIMISILYIYFKIFTVKGWAKVQVMIILHYVLSTDGEHPLCSQTGLQVPGRWQCGCHLSSQEDLHLFKSLWELWDFVQTAVWGSVAPAPAGALQAVPAHLWGRRLTHTFYPG